MEMGIAAEGPNERDRLLRFVRRFCEPETCAALQFETFVNEIGDRSAAERVLKEMWRGGFVVPTNSEVDPEDGALFEVPFPDIQESVKLTSRFILTDVGYKEIDALYDPYLDHIATVEEPDLYVPKGIIIVTANINQHLIDEINTNPDTMMSLSPREFEELVADLFFREGFDVELTPESKDGGRDILAVRSDEFGSHLYLAECKRYAPNRPVGVEYVRALYGVVENEKASRGIIATTSHFTKGAKSFSLESKWRIGLRDYLSIQAWIKQHTN